MPTSAIPGVEISNRRTFPDERGSFLELMRRSDHGLEFVQANHSFSRAGVVRGLHYHRHQHDLWYIVRGRARIGLADLRGREPLVETFGPPSPPPPQFRLPPPPPPEPLVETFDLDERSAATLLIPPGVAHGYLAIDDLDLIYLVTRTYDPDDEHGIAWNDPVLGIDWQIGTPVLSPRDQMNPPLQWPIDLSPS
jgi:dTDP-4-dehydrorhamnose 3,5-epimerase